MKAKRPRQAMGSPVSMFAQMVRSVPLRLHAKAFLAAAGLLALLATGSDAEELSPPPDRTPVDGLILTDVPGTCFATNAAGEKVQCSVPALTDLEPVGSNPRANKMDWQGFEAHTQKWRTKYTNHLAHFSPDYSDSSGMLGPPRKGRLANPLPLARSGEAAADIVVDLDPALHTPEATLGRTSYSAEVQVMRRTGHIIVRHAAEELKYWLDTLTGASIPIVASGGAGRTGLFVGTNFAKTLFPEDLAKLAASDAFDGFAVRARGNAIYIFGATAKGTLNGVYAFLENNSDLIWAHSFSDLGTVHTVNPNLNAVWADGIEIPGTIQRGYLGHYIEVDGRPSEIWMWQMRNRANFIVAPGPSPKLAEWGCWREGGGHCLATSSPRQQTKEFFPWLRSKETGQRHQPRALGCYVSQICMTQPDLPATYAEGLIEYFHRNAAENPGAPLNAFRLGIEDPGPNVEYGVCQCNRCLLPINLPDGRIIPYGHAVSSYEGLKFRSTQFYLLLEYIARAMARETPDTRLSTYAYYFACEAPPFQTMVQPWLSPYGGGGQLSHRDYRHPIFWGENRWGSNWRWWERVYAWSRQTDLTVMRDYHGLLTNGRPFAEMVSWDVRAMLPLGVKRFTNESALNTAFLQMDFWVASRIYWNPEADVEALKKYYLRRTFREGAPEMERFFGEIRQWWYRDLGGNADFVNLGWMIDCMGTQQQQRLYGHLVNASEAARHPVARANVTRLRKTFEHWFHLNLEDATSDAMLANAGLGRHVRYSSFAHAGAPMPVTYVKFEKDAPKDSANLFTPGDARLDSSEGRTFQLRIRPLAQTARTKFPVPHLSIGGDPTLLPDTMSEKLVADAAKGTDLAVDDLLDLSWAPLAEPKLQSDGSYLYAGRLRAMDGYTFDPKKFSRFRLHYPKGAWREPNGFTPEFAIYDLRLIEPDGKRYVMPTLAKQQGNLARKRYYEGGEMGNK